MSKKKSADESRFDEMARLRRERGAREAESSGAATSAAIAPVEKPAGRPTKFKNPDYVQTTVYLPRTLHKPLKVALAEEEKEFSELVERLLSDWLASRK